MCTYFTRKRSSSAAEASAEKQSEGHGVHFACDAAAVAPPNLIPFLLPLKFLFRLFPFRHHLFAGSASCATMNFAICRITIDHSVT